MSAPPEVDVAATDRSMPTDDIHRDFVDALLGSTVGGRYVVTRLLGQGAMGAVFAARHTELEQNVAIKFMFPEFAANRIYNARFAREAKLAAKVQSPYLVRVFDVGRIESGVPYLVMERLTGRDLDAELEERKTLPVSEAVDFALQAATGVGELHGLGSVHRDLKPSNLFIADVGGVRTLKILDFGISKEAPSSSSALTSTESLLGTPSYMSPEQIRNSKDVDARSDIWSLGVILYELVTGRLPFESKSDAVGELFGIILFKDVTPPRVHRADLPQGFEQVVMRCLQRDPADRYRDVVELAEALRPFASGAHGAGAFPRRPPSAAVTMPEGRVDVVAPSPDASAATALAPSPIRPGRVEGTLNAASSTRSVDGPPMNSRRSLWIGLGLGGCLLVGGVMAFGISVRPQAGTDGSVAAGASRSEGSATLPDTATSPTPGAVGSIVPSGALAPTTIEAAIPPLVMATGPGTSTSASSADGSRSHAAHPLGPAHAAAAVRTPVAVAPAPSSAPPAVTPAPAPAKTEELIFDRK